MRTTQHDELCSRAKNFLAKNGFNLAFDDRFAPTTGNSEVPDTLGFRTGASCLIEVKISRSDFLQDKNKAFRKTPSKGMGDWRFFLCPPGIITVEDLPEGWGLLYATAKTIKKVTPFPSGSSEWKRNKPFNANKEAENNYLFSALRRVQIHGHLDCIYDEIPNGSTEDTTLHSNLNNPTSGGEFLQIGIIAKRIEQEVTCPTCSGSLQQEATGSRYIECTTNNNHRFKMIYHPDIITTRLISA